MLGIIWFIALCYSTSPAVPKAGASTTQPSAPVDQATLVQVVGTSFDDHATNLQRMLNLVRDEILDALVPQIGDVKGMLASTVITNMQQPNVTPINNGNSDGISIFPGTDQEFNALLRIIMKTSSCGSCVTCRKGGMCMLNTFRTLSDLVDKYPAWQPPTDIPMNAKMNPLLKDVMKDISNNKDNSDPLVMMWLSNAKLKHLLNPLLQLSMQMPSDKSKGGFNPALLMLTQGQNKIDPMLMMMLSQGKIDPMFLAMQQQGGSIDPMMLAMMNSKDGKMDPSAMMFAMMNKNNNNAPQGNVANNAPATSSCGGTSGCGSNSNPPVAGNNQAGSFGNINPSMLPFLMNGDMDPMLLLTLLGNNNSNNANFAGVSNAAETAGRYGKQRKEQGKADSAVAAENPPVVNYGSRYGK